MALFKLYYKLFDQEENCLVEADTKEQAAAKAEIVFKNLGGKSIITRIDSLELQLPQTLRETLDRPDLEIPRV